MNLRNEVELVMGYNITARTRVNHWAPCASSTPIRKPLNPLSNFEPVQKAYDALPSFSNNKATVGKAAETNNYHLNSNKRLIKKSKIKSRNNFYRPDYDEDEDDEDDEDDIEDYHDNNERKKNLIIKIGSNKCINRRSSKKRNLTNEEQNVVLPICTDEQIKKIVNKEENDNTPIVNCKSNQNYLKNKILSSEVSIMKDLKKCPNNQIHSDVEEEKAQNGLINNNPATENDLMQSHELSKTQSKDYVSFDDNKHVKRKNRSPLPKEFVVKKLKDKQGYQAELKNTANQNKNDALESAKVIKSIGRNVNGGTEENSVVSFTSHEIFSDIKEREWQDSLDLTASDIEIIPDKIKVKSLFNHKKRKNSDDKNKFKHIIQNKVHFNKKYSEKVGPRRARKRSSKNYEESEVENLEVMEHPQIEENSTHSPILKFKVDKESNSKCVEVDKNGFVHNSCNIDFVKDILGMEFNENCTGDGKEAFSHALGWHFSSFKCCALKIDLKSEASGRTKHENSHFGGVLLKGNLLMKINGNEIKLKSGSMFCVPPLTDWKAVNIGRTVCLLYYWCGRF